MGTSDQSKERGSWYLLHAVCRAEYDGNKFFNYFRMSVTSFDELHERLKHVLQRQNTKMRNCIQPMEMLAVTLRYLASGCTFIDLHYTYRIGISTASKIVQDVTTAIWTVLRVDYIPTPTKELWESIASDFEANANFPHCIGAVDGKYIRLICPFLSGAMYFNYKDYDSVVLVAVADSRYRFVFVDIGSYGKDCDALILKKSSLWRSIEINPQQLPEDKCLSGTQSPKLPYFFVGEEAFGLHQHLIRPFRGTHLTIEKRIFNYRLCRARRYVECAFGILSNKWRVLHRQLDFAVDIVKACIVLHNFVRDRNGFLIEDTIITGLEDVPQENVLRGGLTANNIRNIL